MDLRTSWYPAGKKILPRDLVLTPSALLHWYMDDGSRATSGGIYLATDGFSYEEVLFLCEIFARDLDIEVKPHKNDSHHRIYVSARDVERFWELIGPCPVESFAYKWYR